MMNQYAQETQKILDSTERAVEHSLASTRSCNLASGGGLLADFQDNVLPVATTLCDDLHVCDGGSAHTDHLKEEAAVGTLVLQPLLFCSMGPDLTRNPPIQEFNLTTTGWTV